MERALWYMLLTTELLRESGCGGKATKDCDMAACVSSSTEEGEPVRAISVSFLRASSTGSIDIGESERCPAPNWVTDNERPENDNVLCSPWTMSEDALM